MAEFGLRLTFSVLLVSSMSFLGLGLPPPAADWGTMVRENLGGLYVGSLAVLFPAFAIGLFAIGINLVVDWLGGRMGRDISGGFV
jgi:peptide/nickel transport system permease protein